MNILCAQSARSVQWQERSQRKPVHCSQLLNYKLEKGENKQVWDRIFGSRGQTFSCSHDNRQPFWNAGHYHGNRQPYWNSDSGDPRPHFMFLVARAGRPAGRSNIQKHYAHQRYHDTASKLVSVLNVLLPRTVTTLKFP